MDKKTREKEILNYELTIAKQIKNSFVDVKKIEFIPEMSGSYNPVTGYWNFAAKITTSKGTADTGTILFSPKQTEKEIGAFGPYSDNFDNVLKKGKTNRTVKVIFSNSREGKINLKKG